MLRRALDQVGGPNAVSWWAWLVTLPLSVLISSTYSTAPTLGRLVSWTVALVLVHVGVGVVMLIARFTVLPSRVRRSRPITALTVFALMGLVRTVLLQAAQELVGFGSFEYSERLAFNVSISILVFSALAIIIGETREDAGIVVRLTSARASLAELQQQNDETLTDLDSKLLEDVETQLAAALEDPGVDSRRLRELSEDIVRQRSHELAQPIGPPMPERSSPLQAITVIAQRLEVPPPLLVLIPFEIAVFGFVALRYSLPIAVMNTFVGALPSFAGLWLMRRFLPLPSNPWLRVLVLIMSIFAIGFIATITFARFMVALFGSFDVSPFAVASGLTTLSLLTSLWIAVVAGREARQRNLAEAVEQEAREIARTSALIDERRTLAARFLHGSIQNELIAASLRGDSGMEARERVIELFRSYASPVRQPLPMEAISGLLDSWSQVLEIDQCIDPTAADALDSPSDQASLIIDAVSEGLVNAVRHSTSKHVTLQLSMSDGDLVLRMVTQGVANASNPGIGLDDLSVRGAQVELTSDDATTTLVVHV